MRWLALFAAVLALPACTAEPPAGTSAERQDMIRVMSFNPCIDAILVEVADPAQIISISHYSHDLHATSIPLELARRFPSNSGTAEEAIVLRPDLLLTGGDASPATVNALLRAGVRVEETGIPASIAESRAQVLRIAELVGNADRGEALLARIDAALEVARAPAGVEPVSALVRTQAGLVPGPGTLVDEMLRLTGFANASKRYGLAMWDLLALEPLMADPPQILLTPTPDDPFYARIPGMQTANFEERLLQCAGPTMIEAADRLAQLRRSQVQR